MKCLKATAKAPSNLAFIKYWGKKDATLRIPTNNSISVNLDHAITTTTVEFIDTLKEDQVVTKNANTKASEKFTQRISKHIDRFREIAGISTRAFVTTENTVPESVGIASSASGLAALTLATAKALDLKMSEKELSIYARLGSGSACRSIPDGFVEWEMGIDNETSYAKQIAPHTHWDISIITVVVSDKEKKLSSTKGHEIALASPFFKTRIERNLEPRLALVRQAILEKDFTTFGRELEKEAVELHTICMTSPYEDFSWHSGAYYWVPDSLELILKIQEWREKGIETYFTLDAGATVHLICLRKDENIVLDQIEKLKNDKGKKSWNIIVNHPAPGAEIISGN